MELGGEDGLVIDASDMARTCGLLLRSSVTGGSDAVGLEGAA